jgi:hypothetical protein
MSWYVEDSLPLQEWAFQLPAEIRLSSISLKKTSPPPKFASSTGWFFDSLERNQKIHKDNQGVLVRP